MTPTQNKPGIVFCHGLWADGSCFSKLIVPLQAALQPERVIDVIRTAAKAVQGAAARA